MPLDSSSDLTTFAAQIVTPDQLLTGGNGTATWEFANWLGTSNGLPSGGDAVPTPGFGVQGASVQGSAGANGIDHGLMLFINNQVYAASNQAELDGQTLTTFGNSAFSGLDVSVQYYAAPDRPVMRTFASFTNPTDQDITVPISWVTNLGSNGSTEIKALSSGPVGPSFDFGAPNRGFNFTRDNRWVITDDDDRVWEGETFGEGNGSKYFRPANTNVMYGPDNPLVTTTAVSTTVFNSNETQGVQADYQVVIPANSTRSLLFFYGLNSTTAEAKAAATVYNSLNELETSGLLTGLSKNQLAQTLNWKLTTPGVTITPTSGLTTSETGGTATFTVSLESIPTTNVTINLASSNPLEGTAPTGITFTPQNWATAQTITVQGVDDGVRDGDRAYTIQTTVTSTDSTYAAINPADVSLLNLDNGAVPPTLPPDTPNPGGQNPGGQNPGTPDPITGTPIDTPTTGEPPIPQGPTAQQFVFAGSSQAAALKSSTLKALDRIPQFDLARGDRFVLDFDNNPDTSYLPKGLYNAGKIKAKSLQKAAEAAYGDKNHQKKGKQALRADEAVFFRFGQKTYLSVNDRQNPFSPKQDLLVDVTGSALNLDAGKSGSLKVSNYFA